MRRINMKRYFGLNRSGFIALSVIIALSHAAYAKSAASPKPDSNKPVIAQFRFKLTSVHYERQGQGPALLLIHGFPETSYGWRKVIPTLANHFTVVAIDLPGMGLSTMKKVDSYDIGEIAASIHELMIHLGIKKYTVAGQGIGSWPALELAYSHPLEIEKVVTIDAWVPGTKEGAAIFSNAKLWYYGFNAMKEVSTRAVATRESVYLDYFFSSAVTNDPSAFTEFDKGVYLKSYQPKGHFEAACGYFRSIKAFEKVMAARTKVKIEIPVLTASTSYFSQIMSQPTKLAAELSTHPESKAFENSGHWLAEENPAAFLQLFGL